MGACLVIVAWFAAGAVAIYQDGVRLNEPFGDTVNWDLLPANAIASVNLMPGSNPLFGLNALGGAVSVQTKTGFSHPGHAVSLSGGSFGRLWADVQTAGRRGESLARLSENIHAGVLRRAAHANPSSESANPQPLTNSTSGRNLSSVSLIGAPSRQTRVHLADGSPLWKLLSSHE